MKGSAMKCRFTFRVTGAIRLDTAHDIERDGMLFEFSTEQGVLKAISITLTLRDDEHPVYERGAKGELRLDSGFRRTQWLLREIRTIEGLLSGQGLTEIRADEYAMKWLPETQTETDSLQLSEHSMEIRPCDPKSAPILPFDWVARAIQAAPMAYHLEMALGFFRKGMTEYTGRRYIGAIHELYFMIETLYAQGQFKSKAVIKAFLDSAELMDAIKEALEFLPPGTIEDSEVARKYRAKYGNISPEMAVEAIVELRGFLHHHTTQRAGIWNPGEEDAFAADACFLFNLASQVYTRITIPIIYDSVVAEENRKQSAR